MSLYPGGFQVLSTMLWKPDSKQVTSLVHTRWNSQSNVSHAHFQVKALTFWCRTGYTNAAWMQNLQKQCVLKVEFSFALEAAHNEDAWGSDGIAPSIFQLGTKGNNPLLSNGYEVGWASELVWTMWQGNFFSCVNCINWTLQVLYKLIIQTAMFL